MPSLADLPLTARMYMQFLNDIVYLQFIPMDKIKEQAK
jgi:hypothetical protein